MKDRRNNMEIMDVLSSIRRLVSEDRKAATSAPVEAEDAAPREEPPLRRPPEHRFVLTEALRVSDEGDAEDGAPEAPMAIDHVDDVASLEDTIAELEAAVAGLSAGFEPDAGEVHENMAAEPASDWVAEDIIRRRPDFTHVLDAEDLAEGEEGIVSPDAGTSVAAGLEAAMSAQPRAARLTPTAPAVPVDGSDDDAAEGSGGGRLHFSSSVARRPLVLRPDPSEPAGAPMAEVSAADGATTAAEAPEAPAEALAAASVDDFALAADRADESVAPGSEAEDLFDPLADSSLDIDVLRDLVSEIVRDELRGALGDKITRNLRAMIRREIERALEAQGLKRDG